MKLLKKIATAILIAIVILFVIFRLLVLIRGLAQEFRNNGAPIDGIEGNSFNEYVERIEETDYKFGQMGLSLDTPKYFLPSDSFCTDYEYTNTGYHFVEKFKKEKNSMVILYIEYEQNVYYEAKTSMFDGIKPYDDNRYEYQGFEFYKNSNYITAYVDGIYGDRFPKAFTMAGYNDEKRTLMFIGYYNSSRTEIEDWGAFIESIYGEYYDFNS